MLLLTGSQNEQSSYNVIQFYALENYLLWKRISQLSDYINNLGQVKQF